MRKIFTLFFGMLLISSALVAQSVPTASDLRSYEQEGYFVVCVGFEGQVCNDIVFAGSYNGWATSDPASMVKFEPLGGFEGWYVAVVPVTVYEDGVEVNDGKPVQLAQDGSFSWGYQTGDVDSWDLISGYVEISEGNEGESDLRNFDSSEPIIMRSKYWKYHQSPCVEVVELDYTITLKAPDCGGYEPAIIGDFNNWNEGVPMTKLADGTYQAVITSSPGYAFKFRATTDTDWSNEIQILMGTDDYSAAWCNTPNYPLGENTSIYVDYSQGKYTFCDEEVNFVAAALQHDFEVGSKNQQWQFIQGWQTNYWMIGTGAGDASDGNNALYITNNGVNYQYDSSAGSVAWANIPVTLTGGEKISFSWKGVAESCCDHIAVYLFPKGYLPRPGDNYVPENAIEIIASLNGQEDWQEVSEVIVAEGDYYLCFRWRNDGSVGEQACAIDDLSIEHLATTTISPLTYLLNDNNTATVMSCDKSYEGEVVIPATIKYERKNYTVTAIKKEAFMECTALRSVTIPNTVTTIEESAFQNCYALASVDMGEGVTTMGERAFRYCYALTSIELPNNLTSIPEYAFYECSNLNSIDFGDGVESIDYYAFAYCYSLNTLVIPAQITYIDSYGFMWCPLTSIEVETGNRVYDSRNNCNAIVRKEDNALILGCQNTIIPATVTAIGEGAFCGCTSLTSIDIPNSVTTIGSSAFMYCYALTSIELPNNLTGIGYEAFYYCESLTSIDIPASVTYIGWAAFYGACHTITMNSATPPSADNPFRGDATIIVPCDAEDAYRDVYPWYNHTILGSSAYKLDLASTEGGVARITGSDCSTNTYTIEAVSDGRLSFVRWSDGNTDNPRTLTLSADKQLTAEFELVPHNVTDLVVTTNCGKAFASWESDAPWFELQVFNAFGEVVVYDIIDFKEGVSNSNSLNDGQYIWQVRPMYSDSYEDYAGDAVQAGFTISGDNCVDLGVYDLAYSVDGFDVTVTWNSEAPLYRVWVYADYGNLLEEQVVSTKSFNFSVSYSGYYYFYIRGLNAYDTQYSELSQMNIYIESDDEPSQGDCYALSVDYSEGGYVELSTYKECYEEGEDVTLYAYAYEGYEFSHWSTGDTDAEITIAMYEYVEITAYFRSVAVEPACYTLSVTAREGGYVDIYPNKNCYEEGEEVELYATAYEGYVFSHWSDNNTSASRTIVMDRNYQLQAIFVDASTAYEVKNLKLTHSKLNITAKWESLSTRFEVTITDKNDEVVNSEVVELLDANKVYKYKVSKYGKYTVSVAPVDANNYPIGEEVSKTITVVRKYSLSISASTGGTVNGEEVNGDYTDGTEVVIIATPNEGYEFFKWSDGITSAVRTLIMDQDYELVAYFNQKDVAVEDVYADVTVVVEHRTIMVEAAQSQDFALYDVVGHLLERQSHTDMANFTVPNAGLYLLRTNNGFVKVRVR